MQRAIVSSLSGHLQVYDADARDPLEVFGGMGLQAADIGEIGSFADIEDELLAVDNVKTVVPMGIVSVTVWGRNEIDEVSEALRHALRDGDIEALPGHVGRLQRIVESLDMGSEVSTKLLDEDSARDVDEWLGKATTEAFWEPLLTLDRPDEAREALDHIDNNVAQLASDGRMYYLRTIGTDPDQFAEAFDRFYIVQGEPIPRGKRGFLFSHRTYEQLIKHKVAREFDVLLEEVEDSEAMIADDPLLQQRVERMARQYRRVSFQLAPPAAAQLTSDLSELLGRTGTLDELVTAFLTVDDTNLGERHAWFYEHIAPHIRLYEIAVGDDVTLRAYTKSGYVRSVTVPVYGTYELSGLEEGGIMQASNMSDLQTMRELYGKMGAAEVEELAQIKAEFGAREVSRDDAEDMLFGGGAEVAEVELSAPDEAAAEIRLQAPDPRELTFDADEARQGLILNAAIFLDDPGRIRETATAITELSESAGLGLQVIDWQQAAGMTGQFLFVMQAVLLIAAMVIFLVALIIINNAMMMATIDRVPEIGTMRAMGTQRTMVVGLVLVETLLLGVIASVVGASGAVVVVSALGSSGIPAGEDVLVLLFAGEYLYPTWGPVDVLLGAGSVLFVALISALYPSLIAARVQPVVAMQGSEN